MIVNRGIKQQSGDGVLSDIYSSAKKAYNWVKENKPLTRTTGFLMNNPLAQGIISVTPYSNQINTALKQGNQLGQKYGIGKKRTKKTKKNKRK